MEIRHLTLVLTLSLHRHHPGVRVLWQQYPLEQLRDNLANRTANPNFTTSAAAFNYNVPIRFLSIFLFYRCIGGAANWPVSLCASLFG